MKYIIKWEDALKLDKIIHLRNENDYLHLITEDGWYRTVPEVLIYKESRNGKKLAIDNTRVKGVIIDWQTYQEHLKVVKKTYDGDLQGYRRLIRQLDPKQFSYNFETLFFDIEVIYSLDIKNTPDPVVSCVAIDESGNEETWVLHRYFDEPGDDDDYALKLIAEEIELIGAVFDKFVSYQIVSGFNSIKYDIPYLANRYRRLVGHDHWSLWRTYKDEPRFRFSSHVDYLNVLKKLSNHIAEFIDGSPAEKIVPKNYRLNELAYVLLKTRKIDIDIRTSSKEDLIEYNRKDVDILVQFEKKTQQIYGLKLLHYFTGLNVDDLYDSTIADQLLVRAYKNVPFPPRLWNEKVPFVGAIVFDPVPGIYIDVKVLDFAALYPNVIIQHDISPVRYRGKGILKAVLLWMLSLRDVFHLKFKNSKDGFDKTFEMKIKTASNTFYGALAAENFRLHHIESASKITEIGRKCLNELKRICEEMGFKVIYGDTDSVFVVGVTSNDIENINDKLQSEVGERFVIKIDKDFRTFVIGSGKKMYVGITGEGKFKQAGWLKGNVPMIIREAAVLAIHELDRMLHDKDLDIDRQRVILKAFYAGEELIENSTDLSKFGISVDIRKDLDAYESDLAHVRAQRNGNKKLGYDKFGRHNASPYIVLKGRHPLDVMPVELVTHRQQVDLRYYIDRYNGFIAILLEVNKHHSLEEYFD